MNVAAPDGRVISFPDSMLPADIDAAMKGMYPNVQAPAAALARTEVSSAPSQDRSLPAVAQIAGQSLLRGVISTLATPGNLIRAGFGDPAKNPLLSDPETQAWMASQGGGASFPTTNELLQMIASTGVLNNTSVLPGAGPHPELERYGTAALEGIGSALPLMLTGAPPVQTLLQATAGSTAAEAAHQLVPESTAASLLAGAIGGGLTQGGINLATRPRSVAAIAEGLGSSKSLEEAGAALQEGAEEFRNITMNTRIGEAAAPLDAGIPATASTPAAGTIGRVEDLLARGGAAATAAKGFLQDLQKSGGALGATARKINDGLQARALGVDDALPDLSWSEGRKFRTELGTQLRTARPAERPALEHLYGGTSEDLSTIAGDHGLQDDFTRFNQVSTDLHALDAGPIERILAAKQPGDAAAGLLVQAKRGGTVLQGLRSAGLDSAVDELASAHLRLNPDAKAWASLSPEGKAALILDPLDRAHLAAAAPPVGSSTLGSGISHLSGMQLGDLLGMAVGHVIGHPLPGAELYGGALGGMVGYGAPYLGAGARAALRPNMLGAEVVGTVAGQNPLLPARVDQSNPGTR